MKYIRKFEKNLDDFWKSFPRYPEEEKYLSSKYETIVQIWGYHVIIKLDPGYLDKNLKIRKLNNTDLLPLIEEFKDCDWRIEITGYVKDFVVDITKGKMNAFLEETRKEMEIRKYNL